MYEDFPEHDIELWKPSLTVLLLSGMISGAIIGAADGIAHQYLIDDQAALLPAAGLGMALGSIGGFLVMLLRRWIWGAAVSVQAGTILGLLYGIYPAIEMFNEVITSEIRVGGSGAKALVGFMMAFSMLGLLIGAVLDRITDAIVLRLKNREN